MGLDITGRHSDKTYRASYGGLHRIRVLGIQVTGKFDTWDECWDWYMRVKNDELYKKDYYAFLVKSDLMKVRQLLHFSDSEGVLLMEWLLKGMAYTHSFNLGCLDDLYTELEYIRDAITTYPNKFQVDERTSKLFWMLYNLVKDEHYNNGMLFFH